MLLVASLSAAAMPECAVIIEKARSAEAIAALTETRKAMFFYFSEHGGYEGASLDQLYFNPNGGYDPLTGLNALGARQHFEYELAAAGPKHFVLTARRNSYWGGEEYSGSSVSLDQAGVLTPSGVYADAS